MQIVVYDTISLLRPVFKLRVHPKELYERSQKPLYGPDGLLNMISAPMKEKTGGGFDVMAAAAVDGSTVMMAQQMWGLFNPRRKQEASEWAFEQMIEADILNAARAALGRFDQLIEPAGLARIECFILPADPANRALMISNHGLSGFGGSPGYILVQMWPSRGNLARFGAALARLFMHNARWFHTPRKKNATLGDFLVLEGLSSALVSHFYPKSEPHPWLTPFRKPDDWDAALDHLARIYKVKSFSEIMINIYGMSQEMGQPRVPQAARLAASEIDYARRIISRSLQSTDARVIAAHLYGDEIVAAQGHQTVGLPPYAGFEAAHHMVENYLRLTGASLREAVLNTTEEILSRSEFFD
jgi:uncharacterized protein YjaZ